MSDRIGIVRPSETTAPLTREERRAAGRALRKTVPRVSHGDWSPGADRLDPIALLEEQNRARLPEYVPIRMGRMLASPFAFLRGSAIVMAQGLTQAARRRGAVL